MCRTDGFAAKGTMLKGVSIGNVGAWREPQYSIVVVNTKGPELGKTMSGIGVRA